IFLVKSLHLIFSNKHKVLTIAKTLGNTNRSNAHIAVTIIHMQSIIVGITLGCRFTRNSPFIYSEHLTTRKQKSWLNQACFW
ncbi:hypothetical protein, partial [Wohlfahrtiimonas populi]|uniref:hypothetical protein n=1 Tax=Wohlfahrtiimonas populi TaxID=1940240 RepID=UPI001E622705